MGFQTLPIMAGLALVGTALGVHFGRGAIAEIDPVYFSSPEPGTRFHADLVPNRSDWSQVQLAEKANAETGFGLGSGCVNCRAYPEEYYPAPASYTEIGYSETDYEPVVPYRVAEVVVYDEQPSEADLEHERALAQVIRYAHAPTTSGGPAPQRVAYATPADNPAEPEGGEEASVEADGYSEAVESSPYG